MMEIEQCRLLAEAVGTAGVAFGIVIGVISTLIAEVLLLWIIKKGKV